jgi:uncharacterized membrane-anchored protein
MNKSRQIWAIICLVVTGILVIIWTQLSPDKLSPMVMVGDMNIYLPPIVLGIVGIVLLVTARNR